MCGHCDCYWEGEDECCCCGDSPFLTDEDDDYDDVDEDEYGD